MRFTSNHKFGLMNLSIALTLASVPFLRKHLFPYELCLLENPKNANACHSSLITDNSRKLLPSNCLVSWVNNEYGNSSNCTMRSCRRCSPTTSYSRSLQQRVGLRSVWNGLPPSQSGSSYVVDNLDFLVSHGIERIVFLGDSMNRQLATFFACNYFRRVVGRTDANTNSTRSSHIPSRLWGHDSKILFYLDGLSSSFRHRAVLSLHQISGKQYLRPVYDIVRSLLSKCTSFTDPCNMTSSFDDAATMVHSYLLSYMLNSTGMVGDEAATSLFSSNTLFLVNHGLHFQHRLFIPPIARALISFATVATRGNNNHVLFLETTAQHFHSVAGKYNRGDPNKCCMPLSSAATASLEDSEWLVSELEAIRRDWSRLIGWVPMFEATAQMFDQHLEGGDCTHFAYSPLPWERVWWNLLKSLERHMSEKGIRRDPSEV